LHDNLTYEGSGPDCGDGVAGVFKRLRLTILFGLVIFCVLLTIAYLLGLLS
jgi:hypothetical protein